MTDLPQASTFMHQTPSGPAMVRAVQIPWYPNLFALEHIADWCAGTVTTLNNTLGVNLLVEGKPVRGGPLDWLVRHKTGDIELLADQAFTGEFKAIGEADFDVVSKFSEFLQHAGPPENSPGNKPGKKPGQVLRRLRTAGRNDLAEWAGLTNPQTNPIRTQP